MAVLRKSRSLLVRQRNDASIRGKGRSNAGEKLIATLRLDEKSCRSRCQRTIRSSFAVRTMALVEGEIPLSRLWTSQPADARRRPFAFSTDGSSSSNQTVEADLATSPLRPGNNPARERDFDTLGD
jgi:hypothetical protein